MGNILQLFIFSAWLWLCLYGIVEKSSEKESMNTMIWLAKMNDALQYIEENLEGRVDHRRAAEIACASLTRFQRMFTFMTDMTVGDYIRFRKMTLAAEELQKPGARVIDV